MRKVEIVWQRMGDFFWQRSERNYFQLWGPYCLCHNSSSLPLCWESFYKTLFTKKMQWTGSGLWNCTFCGPPSDSVAKGFPGGSVVRNLPANAGDPRDTGSIPRSGRDPGEGNGNPLQYSCLGNPMDRGAWQVTVHGDAKSWTCLSTHICTLCNPLV